MGKYPGMGSWYIWLSKKLPNCFPKWMYHFICMSLLPLCSHNSKYGKLALILAILKVNLVLNSPMKKTLHEHFNFHSQVYPRTFNVIYPNNEALWCFPPKEINYKGSFRVPQFYSDTKTYNKKVKILMPFDFITELFILLNLNHSKTGKQISFNPKHRPHHENIRTKYLLQSSEGPNFVL